jgi:hypothetical protein
VLILSLPFFFFGFAKKKINAQSYVGGLAEQKPPSRLVGPLFLASIRDQFLRTRSGDPNWFERPGLFSDAELREIRGTRMATVLRRSVGMKVPEQVFYSLHTHVETEDAIPAGNTDLAHGTWVFFFFFLFFFAFDILFFFCGMRNRFVVKDEFTITWNFTKSEARFTLNLTSASSPGWMAIGIGSVMKDAYMTICHPPSSSSSSVSSSPAPSGVMNHYGAIAGDTPVTIALDGLRVYRNTGFVCEFGYPLQNDTAATGTLMMKHAERILEGVRRGGLVLIYAYGVGTGDTFTFHGAFRRCQKKNHGCGWG